MNAYETVIIEDDKVDIFIIDKQFLKQIAQEFFNLYEEFIKNDMNKLFIKNNKRNIEKIIKELIGSNKIENKIINYTIREIKKLTKIKIDKIEL